MMIVEALTFHDAYETLLRSLLERPDSTVAPRGQPTRELRDVVVRLPGTTDGGKAWGRTNDEYLLAEFAWYSSRDPSVSFIKDHASLWGRIANPDGTVNSNYGEKLWGRPSIFFPETAILSEPGLRLPTEWAWAKEALIKDPATRQAVVVIHRPEHHWHGNKDVPCTLTLSWMLRDGLLEQRAHMRSSDAWFGMPYDVPFFLWLQRRMAWELRAAGVEARPGGSTLWADSFHLYEHRLESAAAYLAKWRPAPRWVNPVPWDLSLERTCSVALSCLGAAAAAPKMGAAA